MSPMDDGPPKKFRLNFWALVRQDICDAENVEVFKLPKGVLCLLFGETLFYCIHWKFQMFIVPHFLYSVRTKQKANLPSFIEVF